MPRFPYQQHLASVAAALLIGGFVFIASQELATFPVPDTDESMTLQMPYEMLNRGKLAFPMYQFVGGNIENSWHSFTPVFFVILSGFLKVVGWGLAEGRAFNLGCAAITVWLIYLIGRRLVDWQVGLIAVALVVSDPVFLSRSRLIRNDLLPVAFGLLAFYLFDYALEREKKKYFLGSGLAAGAAVMCHTNLIYMLGVLAVLMLLKRGLKAVRSKGAWLFVGAALAVMSYEIVYDLIDYKNFVLQNQRDKIHFRVFDLWGWWENLRVEPLRYVNWYYARGIEFVPRFPLQRVYLLLTVVAIIYLIVRAGIFLRRTGVVADPRVRILTTTLIVILFFALIVQRKVIQYIVYLTPWFALCVAVMLRDGLAFIGSWKNRRWRWAEASYRLAAGVAILVFAVYIYQLGGRYVPSYLKDIRDPDLVTFDEIKEVMRSAVPDGLCPAAIGNGYLWLAFPEHDRCFLAHMEHNLDERLGLDGKDYALFVRPKSRAKLAELTAASANRYPLLAELRWTAYGSFKVYYTGSDSRYSSLPTRRYYFFGQKRGHVSDDQIAAGHDVWTADLSQAGDTSAAIELKPDTIYELNVDAESEGNWAVDLTDDTTGAVILKATAKRKAPQGGETLFKTGKGERVRLVVRSLRQDAVMSISRIRIREIAPVKS